MEIQLDHIMLSGSAVAAWEHISRRAAALLLQAQGIGEIPDERAYLQADGSLKIEVKAKGFRLEMTVPKGEWKFQD